MPIDIRVPAMGEGITDVTITRWLVQQGDKVTKDTPLVEIATDKVDSEITSPHEGIIQQLLFKEGDSVKVGETIIVITQENENGQPVVNTQPTAKKNHTAVFNHSEKKDSKPVALVYEAASKAFISPFIRQIASNEGILADELERVQGSGEGGRLTKTDMLQYLERRTANNSYTPVPKPVEEIKPYTPSENETVVQLDRTRKLIAKNMLHSKNTAPHVTSFVEANVTKIVNWRNKVKDEFQRKYNEKITYLPVFLEAVTRALKDFPTINASLQNETLILKKDINLGIATALPDGNLIVPVIKKTDTLGISGLTKAINTLAVKARKSQLLPSDIQGGTFTITNIGTFGNIGGTPIINQPELAILAIGTIIKKPVAVKLGNEYGIAIQDTVELWLSYDHRVIDGFLGGSFLKRIADYLEQFDETLTP
ncbi:MAG TPA: dihydrolipoamide acetyltransferase family protein [Bacteroidales bacterium]|nr:dihydrolipoamide acetyltransferase family protein [Bacteroidales bacterium]